MLDVLIEFDIIQKLYCITSDNAGNMKKLMRCLSKRLRKRGIKWKAEENHISCLNHVLNLAVQEFLRKVKAIAPKTDDTPDLKDKEVDYSDDDRDLEDSDGEGIDLDFEDEDHEEDDDEEEILDNSAAIGDDDYDDIAEDFQGTMKKLRGVAKVYLVAYKMRV